MRLVERRIGLLFAVFLAALVLASMRAAWLGTVQADDLRGRAVAQQVEDLIVPARRGTVTDRHGVELAVSEDSISVFANPLLIKDPAGVAAKLSPLLGRRQSELLEILGDRRRGFAYLARKQALSRGDAIAKLRIEGLGTLVEPRRRYPQGPLAGQVLGAVGIDNYGLAGIEQAHDRVLRGSDGRRQVVKDALGKPINIVETRRAVAGRDLRLTIDAAIQERVERVLAGVAQKWSPKGATALVVDPRNGELLAMANWPAVDPIEFGSASAYARQNRAVSATYEPGSTFKAFTVSGALERRLITPGSLFHLPPEIEVADRTIGEAHDRGAVTLDVANILKQSSNVGSVRVGQRLGVTGFDSSVRGFGFGAATGVDLPGESPGIVPRPAQYSGSSLGNMSIGQGLAVTPMQMAAAYSALSRAGVAHRPHIRMGGGVPKRQAISAPTARSVARMLEGVLGPGGTAQEARVEGYRLAGKTGTAEKPDKLGGYSNSRFVSSFIGFAPARDPRLLVAVVVDEPQREILGGVVAAPAFEEIMAFALPYLRIAPD